MLLAFGITAAQGAAPPSPLLGRTRHLTAKVQSILDDEARALSLPPADASAALPLSYAAALAAFEDGTHSCLRRDGAEDSGLKTGGNEIRTLRRQLQRERRRRKEAEAALARHTDDESGA